jgi:hypothetical protein
VTWCLAICICWFSRTFLLGILIFKGLTARRLYKSFDFKGLTKITKDNLRLMWIIIYYYQTCWISADYYRCRCDSLSQIMGDIYDIRVYPLRDTTKPQPGLWPGARDIATEDLSG